MSKLSITDGSLNSKDLFDQVSLNNDLQLKVASADVVLLPNRFKDEPFSFYVGTTSFFNYLKDALGDRVEICINDTDYCELELCSRQIRLGKIAIKKAALNVVLPLIIGYAANQIPPIKKVVDPAPVNVEYMEPTTISFTIIVTDADSTSKSTKEILYEGPADELDTVIPAIKQIWDE